MDAVKIPKAPAAIRLLLGVGGGVMAYGGYAIESDIYLAVVKGAFYLPLKDIIFGGLMGLGLLAAAGYALYLAIRGRK